MARQSPRASQARRAFTLIELLVVILIIGLISVVALPTILPALQHRQVSEAARILQGAIVGARDKAIHDGQPSGIRLLPDPAFNGINPSTGRLDPAYPLAWNRVIPIGPAPDYSEGKATAIPPQAYGQSNYALSAGVSFTLTVAPSYPQALMICQSARQPGTGAPNAPTSWSWNVRVGDKVQLNNAGPWYTVIGPVATPNPEQFVNTGPPGGTALIAQPQLTTAIATGNTTATDAVEFLLLVNGHDDNGNGWIDEGFDGVDNNANGTIDEPAEWLTNMGYPSTAGVPDTPGESETWLGAAGVGVIDAPYTIARRPAPSTNAREIALPTGMVIDATTGFGPSPTFERSRLPINPNDGSVDILLRPDGTAIPTTTYGVPTSQTMGGTFYHLWLSERQDVAAPAGTAAPLLPILQPAGADASYTGPTLKGEYSLLTLFTRSGQIAVNPHPAFDDPLAPANGTAYDPGYPFRQAQQGVSQGP